MVALISRLNDAANAWLATMATVSWQALVLLAVAMLLAWLLRRFSPTVRYWLWQIVAIKLLLMPFWTFAVPLPSWAVAGPTRPTTTPTAAPVEGVWRPPLADFGGSRPMDSATAMPSTTPKTLLPPITWQAGLLLAWTTMIAMLAGRVLVQRIRLAALLRQGVPAGPDVAELVRELASQLGLRNPPEAVSVAGDCPLFVCGMFRPRIVLPAHVLSALDPAERRHVVLHELAHLKRRDLPWGWPIEIAKTVYFFHPAVYWIASQLRLERELACDQLAMAHGGGTPAEYAKTLVEVVRRSNNSSPRPQAGEGQGVRAAVISEDD